MFNPFYIPTTFVIKNRFVPNVVKIIKQHKTGNCLKPKKSKAKCANYGETHTINWKAYKKAEERLYPMKTTEVQRLFNKIS